MSSARPLRIGTRNSPLARWQAEWVAARLGELGAEVELVPISTRGDREQSSPIGAIGTQGVFTKEIQAALVDQRVDVAVHSLKDLPTEPVKGLALVAVPERGPVGDVLVSTKVNSFDELPSGAVIGTGSLRRRAQLLHVRPDLVMADIRGNVDTRLRKLEQGEYDALVLAEAGLERLGLQEHAVQLLPKSLLLSAVGQGALGLEGRSDDERTAAWLRRLDHRPTHAAVVAERAMLAALRGGCLAPVGAWGRCAGERLTLSGLVLSADGRQRVAAEESGAIDEAAELGRRIAARLFDQGAAELIATARQG